jgi:thioredoxin-related protein
MSGRIFLASLLVLPLLAFTASTKSEVGWMSFEQAVAKTEAEQRKIFIDVYTDWCGWCKKMDASTFSEARVAKYLREKFYPVKLDAEQTADIQFNDHTFKFIEQGRRGYHELAAALLNGKMSYPSVVFLNEKFEIIQVLPGYRKADEFLKIAKFIGDNHYLTTSWDDYSTAYDAKPQPGE